MPPYLRQSFAAKITACGFILLILVGQVWLAKHLFAQPPSGWMIALARLGLAAVACGGLGLGCLALKEKFYGP